MRHFQCPPNRFYSGYYTSTKSWRGYIFTAVCLCVCLCVCVCVCVRHFLWTKFQPNECTELDAVFARWLLPALAQTLLNLVTLGQRSRSQWRNTHFFLPNSLLTSLLCISALLCSIKIKFGMSLRYTIGRFVIQFHEIRMGEDVIVTVGTSVASVCASITYISRWGTF